MKILIIDFDDLKNPLGGGQARVTFEIARRLSNRHQITIITGNYPGAKDETIESIRYKRIGLKKFPFNFLSYFWQIPKIIKKIPHDLVIENFTPPISTAFTPLFTKKPVIGMIQWLFAREMSQKYKLPFYLIERYGLKFYQNFIVLNEDFKTKILESNPRANILVNTFAVDAPPKIPKSQEEDYILFLGRIDIHQKGLDLLIKSFESIVSKTKTILKIAGDGKDRKKLLKLINKAQYKERIVFLGKYSPEERTRILSFCKFVCIPSRYEVQPLVAKEAMSLGKPLIIYDVIGLGATVNKKCAIYIRPFNTQAYGEAILTLLRDKQKRAQMGQEAQKSFNKLPTWDQAATTFEEFCLKIIDSSVD